MILFERFINEFNEMIKLNRNSLIIRGNNLIKGICKILTDKDLIKLKEIKGIIFIKINKEGNRIKKLELITKGSRKVFIKLKNMKDINKENEIISSNKGVISIENAIIYGIGGLRLIRIIYG